MIGAMVDRHVDYCHVLGYGRDPVRRPYNLCTVCVARSRQGCWQNPISCSERTYTYLYRNCTQEWEARHRSCTGAALK